MREVIFNNSRLNDYVIVKNIKESIVAPIEATVKQISGEIGGRLIKQEMKERKIVVDAELIADTLDERQEIIDIIAPILFVETESILMIDGYKKYLAVFEGSSDLEDIMYDSKFSLTFVAPDPLAQRGRTYITVKNNETYINKGNFKTRGVITAKATENSAKVSLRGGKEYDYVEIHNLVPGDDIRINFEKEYVAKNNKLHMKNVDPFGEFFFIPPGNFGLNINGLTSVKLDFREKWL